MSGQCNRCKTAPPLPNDSYCLGCSAWEGIGRDLQAPWGDSGCRGLATEFLVAGARHIRALRNLSASWGPSAGQKPSGQPAKEAQTTVRVREREPERPALERRRPANQESLGVTPKQNAVKQKPTSSSSSESELCEAEESEEEKPVTEHQHQSLNSGGDRRPPEPDGPPPRSSQKRTEGERERDRSKRHRQEHHRHRHRDDRHSRKPRKPRHRAGRKHQRLARLGEDPFKNVHRRLPDAFFEEQLSAQGRAALPGWCCHGRRREGVRPGQLHGVATAYPSERGRVTGGSRNFLSGARNGTWHMGAIPDSSRHGHQYKQSYTSGQKPRVQRCNGLESHVGNVQQKNREAAFVRVFPLYRARRGRHPYCQNSVVFVRGVCIKAEFHYNQAGTEVAGTDRATGPAWRPSRSRRYRSAWWGSYNRNSWTQWNGERARSIRTDTGTSSGTPRSTRAGQAEAQWDSPSCRSRKKRWRKTTGWWPDEFKQQQLIQQLKLCGQREEGHPRGSWPRRATSPLLQEGRRRRARRRLQAGLLRVPFGRNWQRKPLLWPRAHRSLASAGSSPRWLLELDLWPRRRRRRRAKALRDLQAAPATRKRKRKRRGVAVPRRSLPSRRRRRRKSPKRKRRWRRSWG